MPAPQHTSQTSSHDHRVMTPVMLELCMPRADTAIPTGSTATAGSLMASRPAWSETRASSPAISRRHGNRRFRWCPSPRTRKATVATCCALMNPKRSGPIPWTAQADGVSASPDEFETRTTTRGASHSREWRGRVPGPGATAWRALSGAGGLRCGGRAADVGRPSPLLWAGGGLPLRRPSPRCWPISAGNPSNGAYNSCAAQE